MAHDPGPSLASYLGLNELGSPEGPTAPPSELQQALDITDAKKFAQKVLGSREFRQYIVSALTLGTIPSAIITRMMDYGWGRPVERVEHTGRDGKPIEAVTEIRRIVVRATLSEFEEEAQVPSEPHSPVVHYDTH